MKKVGVFGGTFDPIHHGHLITASAVKEIRELEKIILIPAWISPFKLHDTSSSPKHRLEMLKLAIESIPGFEISEIEIKEKDVSYTIDTIKKLKKKYDKVELIIGYDHFLNFSKWKDPDILIELVELIVMKRKTQEKHAENNLYFKKAIFVETPLIEISGTDIRRRVKENLPIDFLVPKNVKEYICSFQLYKG